VSRLGAMIRVPAGTNEATVKEPLTYHAVIRMRQRGIDGDALDCLLAYGSTVHDHRGGEILLFDKRAWRRLEREADRALMKRAAENRGLYAVRSSDGELVTVGHRYRRFPRD
jgi:hypothetical protein